MDKLTKKGLDGTQLKTIALVLMVLDHIHYFFEFTGWVPIWFSMLGRLSAPLFLFCTVEGFAHTHDRKRYVLRIWAIGTAMAALEFFMIYAGAFRRGDGFYPQNAIFQDLVLLCVVWQGIDWLREKKIAKGAAAIAAVLCWPYMVVAFLLLFPQVQDMPIASAVVAFLMTSPLPMWTAVTDGSWGFLLGGVLLYALRGHRPVQLGVWALNALLWDLVLPFAMVHAQADFVWTQMFTDYYEWFGVGAVVLMLLYNGRRGSGHKQLFYWFYPAHIYLLYGASCLLYNVMR
ncbi:TraX family protein [Faecalibacterium sp. Marseille-Q3530]|uniref:TraX family protein n=1 Tax=Faecalibacterium sp. Marseille-Q3530 TaxID=2758403 RepID=UPI001A9A7BBC|nr:TraX family protein [Faecalibacterium sp. Marseille-Q3530]MBO1289854.1 TraX protein [Faecalibacterium sp. Marseille-Q3530]